jgi:hypothetical protein
LQRQFLPYEASFRKRVSMRSSPNSSKTFAYRKAPPYRLRLPHQENTLIILQCFAQPLFERFAIGSFIFVAAFSIFIRY